MLLWVRDLGGYQTVLLWVRDLGGYQAVLPWVRDLGGYQTVLLLSSLFQYQTGLALWLSRPWKQLGLLSEL